MILGVTPVNGSFRRVKNKSKMTGWLLRQYFDPKNNVESPWFSKKVDAKNVLGYISDPQNGFPLTPAHVADMWKTMESFKQNLRKSEKELGPDLGLSKTDLAEIEIETAESSVTYQTGEVTLEKIGQTLGGLTPTMINKLVTSGMEKFRSLTYGKPFEELTEEEIDLLNKKILEYRFDAAFEFAEDLKAYGGDIKGFLALLVKKQMMTANDVSLISDGEVAGLVLLIEKDVNEIAQVLLKDIAQPNNLFKSYQGAVSRKAFPAKKRGRPKKVRED